MVCQSLVRRLLLGISVLLLAACADIGSKPQLAQNQPPPAPREFRGVWVASVANIDWPSRRDLTVAQQQSEIIAILDRAKNLNLNAIVLQVRTGADALYDSKLEPWSEYLTGEQGRAPDPYYDPLKMWVAEAHLRGLELHAWFNPYRARHIEARSPTAKNHIANTNPQVVKSYGGFLWMDPGETAASDQTLKVILDVVRRYDIDGVHIDDYFYPYPVPAPGSEAPPPSPDDTPQARTELPFPDEPAWQAYLANNVAAVGKLARADWRRQNVNNLVERIYTGIKREKPLVKFGISPFGLGKPDKRPAGIAGFSQYDKLYADAELWLQKGWLDYFTPQLYWAIDQKAQAYGVLLDYWAKENSFGRHLWPGIYTSRINETEKSWMPNEIVNQIALTRTKAMTDPLVTGHVHFSMVALLQNRKNINDQLREKIYRTPALVPASPWLGSVPPPPPQILLTRGRDTPSQINMNAVRRNDEPALRYAIWTLDKGAWRLQLSSFGNEMPVDAPGIDLDENAGLPEMVVWSSVDRAGIESERVTVTRQQLQAATVLAWRK